MMQIKITLNEKGNPPGKVADAELHFTPTNEAEDEALYLLAGLKLIGFSVWERRGKSDDYNVTFPARQYAINGERRAFALLRPIEDVNAQNRIREAIIEAYKQAVDNDTADAATNAVLAGKTPTFDSF